MRIRQHLFSLLAAASLAAQTAPTPNPHLLVDSAIAAMGGGDLVGGLASFRIAGIQHEYIMGNAERAEGPWRAAYTRFSELWDVRRDQLRRTYANAIAAPGLPGSQDQVVIISDSVMSLTARGRIVAGYPGFFEDYRYRTSSSPSAVLLSAASSPALRWERRVVRFGAAQDVVAVTGPDGIIRIELDRSSHLPTAVELLTHSRLDDRRAPFGDVTIRVEYVNWTSQPNGLWWPMQHRFLFNGELYRDMVLSTLAQNVPVASDSFVVADSTRTEYASLLRRGSAYFRMGDGPEPVQPGGDIVRLADFWAMTLVKQDDGVVIFEAHMHDQYIKQVVADVHKRWPGVPIKAFVLSSDPWGHLGGVREVIAMGVPIYVSAGSIPFLTAMAKEPFTLQPDDLARTPRPPHFIGVSAKTVVGTGKNRFELYPVGGAYAERMTMAWFPARRLLYGADLVFPDRAPAAASPSPAAPVKTFLRTPALDLRRAVAREKLPVDSVFGVQAAYPLFAWSDFVPSGSRP